MFTPADTISIPTSRLKENIPDIAAITGNTLWGFSLLLSKTALSYALTGVLLSIRFIIAFLLMNLILLFKIEHISLKGKNILPVLLLALNDVAYFYCESYGIALTNSMFVHRRNIIPDPDLGNGTFCSLLKRISHSAPDHFQLSPSSRCGHHHISRQLLRRNPAGGHPFCSFCLLFICNPACNQQESNCKFFCI